MAPITDFLIGDSSLKRQRDTAIDYARDAYDPSVFQPAVSQAATTAAEGIGQEQRDIMRARTVQSLFTPTDSATFRGNQASQLAGQQTQTQARQQALAGFEGQLSQADIQTQQQGEQQLANLQTQQRQVQGQQEAAIDEAELQYEAEKSRRKQALAGAALGLVGNLVTTPFGDDMQSLAGRGLQGLFGDGDDSEPTTSEVLANMARSVNAPEAPQPAIMDEVDIPNFEIDFATNQLRNNNLDFGTQGSVVPMGNQSIGQTSQVTEETTQPNRIGGDFNMVQQMMQDSFTQQPQIQQLFDPNTQVQNLSPQPQQQGEVPIGQRQYSNPMEMFMDLFGEARDWRQQNFPTFNPPRPQ